ncbi:MAG: molybdenum cofactor guanylyltransferase [Candidatus Melainabacteria bacterium]|nr:molybdenum cofactor guanylyltransferase [Candidatus Melainabacteria bacterium]
MTKFIENQSHWQHTGAILAGGQSKRMGRPKEGVLLWDLRPMIEHVMDILQTICKSIVIVGKCEGYYPKQNKFISDRLPNLGPIGGIESLLSSNLDTEYLVVACDQPFLTQEILKFLIKDEEPEKIKLFKASGNKKINPFPGYYPASILSHVKDSIQKGRTAMHEMIVDCPSVTWIPIQESQESFLRSINTPSDLFVKIKQ